MSLYYVVIKTMWRDDYHRQDCWSEAGPVAVKWWLASVFQLAYHKAELVDP